MTVCRLLLLMLFKIIFDQLDYRSGQQEQRDQVWYRHQAVEGFCDAPEHAKIDGCAKDCYERIYDHKWFDNFFREQELNTA